jgi:hypothetical protein
MADDRVFAFDNEDNATQLLQGLISPVPAQALVTPPPDIPPRSGPGETTPLTGSLAAPPSQATPKVDPVPLPEPRFAQNSFEAIGPAPNYNSALATQLEQAHSGDSIPTNPYEDQYKPGLGTKIRRGLAGYFSGGVAGALRTDYNAPNGRYASDEAARQQRLADDEGNIVNLKKGYETSVKAYQQTLDQARSAALARRNSQIQQPDQPNADLSQPADAAGADSGYVKVLSKGQVGYLPKANLAKAQQRDKNLKVLE